MKININTFLKRNTILVWLLLTVEAVSFAQIVQRDNVKNLLTNYFANYDLGIRVSGDKCVVEDVRADEASKMMFIFVSEAFGMQPFDQQKVDRIYREVRLQLAGSYTTYKLYIYAKDQLIDELVPGGTGNLIRSWQDIRHRGNAWVTPLDRPYDVEQGLQDRHLCLWASHGRFYSLKDSEWQWQRPNLFCTTEDLLSQTFVVPYLMPMLENAGAIIYSPRERDWQKHEVIIDNDQPNRNGLYLEINGHHNWEAAGIGFAHLKDIYLDRDNPFLDGTARMAATQTRQSQASSVAWIPTIPEDGDYAVYVSYITLPNSVSDANYTVRHAGQTTHFRVNQQMGGATWVYLGTFFFKAGNSQDNCVLLSNQSNYRGYVTADGVRFGGGMGNIARGDSINHSVSGLPRFLEAARYSVQWAGAPYEAYASKASTNDYAEDINARSAMENYLARGSAYVPGDSGLHVPIEMSVALHTDAGITRDSTFIGSLGIYTTDFNGGILPSGLSRLTSRDLCDRVLTQVYDDLDSLLGRWTRRQMFDRNYSETREPMPPAIILEMLSHQNFNDMRMAHDPYFKFLMARSIYKGILRTVHSLHNSDAAVVQPLPVSAPAAHIIPQERNITLTWLATSDPLEASAMPTGFVVYHAIDDGDFDNGTLVDDASFRLSDATTNVLHRFRITACNKGGQSMPSQEICAYIYDQGGPQVLIVDAFDRLAGPRPFENDTVLGFDLTGDPGVPMAKMPGFCGPQICFNKATMGREGYGALGYSTSELEGTIVAGNTMDWSTRHARDIIAACKGRVNIGSCTAQATERAVFDSRSYQMMDLVFGLNKADHYSLLQTRVFSPRLIQMVAEFVRSGGNILASGAYVGTDLSSDDDRLFARSILKYDFAESLPTDSLSGLTGMSTSFDIYRTFNEKRYRVSSVDCIQPTEGAFCPLIYTPTQKSAAVAYNGTDYRAFTLGFPLESIIDDETRIAVLRGIIQFLIP
jgi:hypothetical protein